MAIKNKLEDLRNHLFATLEALQYEENPMEPERAKAIVNVADAIIDSAKLDLEYMRIQVDAKSKLQIELNNNFLNEAKE